MLSSRLVKLMWIPVAFAALGCVPYQTYQQTKKELQTAREAYEDLSRKYNEAMMRLASGDTATAVPADDRTLGLEAQLLELKRENEKLKKESSVQPAFTPKEFHEMGVPGEGGGAHLGEDLLFSEGSANLKRSAFAVLDRIIKVLNENYPGEMIIIEGHTDNQPLRRTKQRWKYNIRLGYERAQAVFEYFVKNGVGEDRMVIRTYSFNKPTDPRTATTKEGRARNRRVVVRRGGTQI